MNETDIKNMIKRHEGFRDRVYIDSVGVPTAGYGHAFLKGSPVPSIVCDILFEEDFKAAKIDYEMLANRFNLELNAVRRGVIIDMLFNMGLARVMGFGNMLAALADHDYEKAADEMIDSRWARQVGRRAQELAEIMRRGEM